MKRALLRTLTLYTRNLVSTPTFKLNPSSASSIFSLASTQSKLRFYSSSENDSSNKIPDFFPDISSSQSHKQDVSVDVEKVSDEELKMLIEKFSKGDKEVIPLIFEAILQRKLSGKQEETVDELMEEIGCEPLDVVKDGGSESDFEELSETDEECEDLCDTRDIMKDK